MTYTSPLPAGWQPAPDLLKERIILLTGAASAAMRRMPFAS